MSVKKYFCRYLPVKFMWQMATMTETNWRSNLFLYIVQPIKVSRATQSRVLLNECIKKSEQVVHIMGLCRRDNYWYETWRGYTLIILETHTQGSDPQWNSSGEANVKLPPNQIEYKKNGDESTQCLVCSNWEGLNWTNLGMSFACT